MNCKVCDNQCNTLNQGVEQGREDDWYYCCLHLPSDYITRPLNEWLCQPCGSRVVGGEI